MPITSVLSSRAGIGQFAPTIATFNEEYDEMIRDCEVLIYLTPLPIAILKDLDWNSVKHWALVFKYDNRTILFELVNLTGSMVGGLIKPSWRDFDENNVSIFSNEVSLGTIKTSPREVYIAAKDHPMNETNYHVRNNNCQEWVLIMLDKVDLLNLKNYTNIEEAQKLGMMAQIFGWAKSILSKKDEQENNSDDVRPDIQTLMEIVEQKGLRPLKADGVLLPASVGSMHYFSQKKYYLAKKGNKFF